MFNLFDVLDEKWATDNLEVDSDSSIVSEDSLNKVINTNVIGKVEFEVYYRIQDDTALGYSTLGQTGTVGVFSTNDK